MKEEIWVSVDDLKRVFLRYRHRIAKCALVASCVLFVFLLTRPPQYLAEAVFKLGSGKLEQNYDLKNFFQTLVSKERETSVQAIFTSTPVMRRTIEELGMQVHVATHGRLFSWLKRAACNLKAELSLTGSGYEMFQFQDVSYEGAHPIFFILQMKSSGLFEVTGKNNKATFQIGEPVQIEDVTFTLMAAPTNLKLGTKYVLSLSPWKKVVENTRSAFKIKSSKSDPNIVTLLFTDPDRLLGARFLNTVMKNYQEFLKEEAQQIADSQLQYLDSRQKVLQERLDHTLQDHVVYLQQHLGERGFVGIHQEIETLSHPQEMYNSKLFDIEFDLAHFDSTPTQYVEENENVSHLHEKLSSLSLEEKKLVKTQNEHLFTQIEQASLLLSQVETDKPLPTSHEKTQPFAPLVSHLEEAKTALANASDNEKEEKERLATAAKNDLTEHLRDFIHSLHLKQKTTEENSLYAKTLETDFRGLDLETAKSLNIQYHGQLDNLHLALKQLLYLRDQIRDPAFDLGSMVNTALDPITQQLVQKAADLEIRLHDDKNHSQREHQRLREALSMQKKYISSHIAQTLDLHKIRIELTREKIATLQVVMADLLKIEKKLVEEKLENLKSQMSHLPEKWRIENLLKIKKEMTESMVQGLSHITESKIINRHLYNIESRPLDPAFTPLLPNPPRIFILTLTAALVTALAVYFFFLLQNLLRGLSPSVEYLRRLGQIACGPLSERAAASFSELFDLDREIVRRIADSIIENPKNSAIALMFGKYCDYSRPLVELLSMRGKSAIVLDCNFGRIVTEDEIPGLWQYLNKEISHIPIRSGRITSGGTTHLVTELLQKPEFSSLVSTLKKEYDFVLLVSRASLSSTEAYALQQISDMTILSYEEELCSDLLVWTRQKENHRVIFILNEALL